MNARPTFPVIAVMMGDPAGIGPEVCVRAVCSSELHGVCKPFIIGNLGAARRAAAVCGLTQVVRAIDSAAEVVADGSIQVLDPHDLAEGAYQVGKASAASGVAVVNWIKLGESLGASGRIDGFVLGPVDSDSLKMGGLVKDIDDLQPAGTYMFRISGNLRVVPITEHIRIRDIASTVTTPKVLELIRLLDGNLKQWGLPTPRIAVAGLNPHAMFEEDREQVAPAVVAARELGIDAHGPISPDSVFRMTLEGRYDAVVTMYHDQGQVAVKTTAFEGACTIYMGMPYVLINIPHGSAFDIAGQGVAQHASMTAGIRTAAALASGQGFLAH